MKKVISVLVAVAMLASMSVLAMTSASAVEETWALPLDVTDANWHAEAFSPTYKWAAPLAEVADTIIGESNADGTMSLKFPEGGKEDMTYPHARYESASGIVHVSEDDYVNVKLSVGDVGQTDVQWSMRLNFLANSVRLDNAIAAAIGAEQNTEAGGTWVICGGDIEFSLKISDVAKEWLGANSGDGKYDAIWGTGGNDFLTGVVFYLFSKDRNSEIPFTIKSLTIGEQGAAAGDNGGAAAGDTNNGGTNNGGTNNGGTTSTGNKAPTPTKAPSGNKGPVKTGESVLPIVGVAALAVVAGSAVVVSRKRK